MKVLVACEYSGTVRDAFTRRGHDAWSCDLLPSDGPGNHIQCDALELLGRGWDLLIAHPPCQYLTVAGNAWINRPGRREAREKALELFIAFCRATVGKICVENPVGYPCSAYRPPDQIIHPYYFGDREMKRTALWLKNLHPLSHAADSDWFIERTHTAIPEPVFVDSTTGKKRYFTDAKPPGPDRWKERSKTFPGIAAAMAAQWG